MSHFDHAANEWDSPEKIKLMKSLATAVKEKLNLNSQKKIIDFGCGTGLFSLEFYDQAKSIVGIDTSKEMLKVFKKKEPSGEKITTKFINLENDDTQLKADLILSSMAFHHLNKPSKVLAKLKKMLSPGGEIIIVDLEKEDGSFHPDNEGMGVKHFGFSKDELVSWAHENDMSLEIHRINSVEKNDKIFHQFMCRFN